MIVGSVVLCRARLERQSPPTTAGEVPVFSSLISIGCSIHDCLRHTGEGNQEELPIVGLLVYQQC